MFQKMNRNKLIAVTLGVVVAILCIYEIHGFMIVDACLDFGGQFIERTGICIDENNQEHIIVFPWAMLAVYIVVGLVIASTFAFIANKILSIISE